MIHAFPVRCICWTWNLSTKPTGSEEKAEFQIVGLGTFLSSDDEIGLALVSALAREKSFEKRCLLLENSDAATVAASLIEWRRPILLVDAADMRINPGEYRFFADCDASVILKTSSVSTHGLGLPEGLELARVLGFDHSVYIFGVQPFDIAPGQGITPEMSARFPLLLDALRNAWMQL
jgi:hydrogenase maturation protease